MKEKYYYRSYNDEWFVREVEQGFDVLKRWADIIIKIESDGRGWFVKGDRSMVPDLLLRKYAAADYIYKDEMLPLALRARYDS